MKLEIRRDFQNPENNKLTVYHPSGGFVRWYGEHVTKWLNDASQKSKKSGKTMRYELFQMVSEFA